METTYIDIDGNKWGIILITRFNLLDWDDMAAIMQAFGLPMVKVRYAIRVLSAPNTGLTISNPDLRMSVVFVSDTTSNGEFWNSIAHECKHVVDAVIGYYDESCDGESAAYLQGHIFQKIVEKLAEPCY